MEERNRTLAEKRRANEESATSKALNDILESDLLAQALLSYVPPSVAAAPVAPMNGRLLFQSNMDDVQLVLDGTSWHAHGRKTVSGRGARSGAAHRGRRA